MNLLILTRYDTLGASSRLRFYKYKNFLESSGFKPTFQPLLPNLYLQNLYAGKKRSKTLLLIAYIRRLWFLLFSSRQFSVVWIEKELFPGLPTAVDLFFLRRFHKKILDFDDAIHLNYKNARWGRENKIERLMAESDIVFAGSPYLQETAVKAGGGKVVRIPTAVSLQSQHRAHKKPVVIGWIGSPASEFYILDLLPIIQKFAAREDLTWKLLGANSTQWQHLKNVEVLEWNSEAEKHLLANMDLGIMPLRDGLWERGKCSYKILLYNSWGIPAMASPVGMNTEVVQDDVNGYLVTDNWEKAIDRFVEIPIEKYQELSRNAYRQVQDHFTFESVYKEICENLQTLSREV